VYHCGFGERTHPQIAWAKLRSLVEGARLASQALAGSLRSRPPISSKRGWPRWLG